MKRLLYVLVALCALICVCACGQGHTESEESQADSSAIRDSIIDDSIYANEDVVEPLSLPEGRDEAFSDFIFSFLLSRKFQAERIKFPLPVIEMNGQKHEITSGREFRRDFRVPSRESYTVLLGDREQMEVFQNDLDLADVKLNCITLASLQQTSYHFLREKCKWYLSDERKERVSGLEADFLEFYNKFTTDSVFQQESISQPLKFSTPNPNDELSSVEGTIDASQWPVFRPELPHGVITNIEIGQNFENPNRILLLHCGLSNGMMDVFTFQKDGGKWKLVSFEN